jgi:formyltetrahydrofolate deformylase
VAETPTDYVLTLSCPDTVGIVQAVSTVLVHHACSIAESQQFGDEESERFFMRVHFRGPSRPAVAASLRSSLGEVASEFRMTWELHDGSRRGRVLLMVSKQGHCLNDLLYRHNSGALNADVTAVVSNHADFEGLVTWYGLPFHHVPVDPDDKPAAEHELLRLVERYDVDAVVLARYMQVLSNALCEKLQGRVINIHHSLLPSFKGSKPYEQAYRRGVKLIGATAHFVTPELDEGPIIEQAFARVDHGDRPERLAAIGRDLEALALARAVEWYFDHRILLNGDRTVVFR